jgi:hypothetical protein
MEFTPPRSYRFYHRAQGDELAALRIYGTAHRDDLSFFIIGLPYFTRRRITSSVFC